ncbi:MAG: TonB-dependent receptor [Bacteroidetes bacterium]|nr:TonB-dependent receptor [Bacteroidota bacterium]
MKRLLAGALFIIASFYSLGQEITQTVRGTVSDIETNYPIVGAKLKISVGTDKILGAIADSEGNFSIQQVPVGKHTLIATSVGYEAKEITVIVTSGKESVVTVLMTESAITSEEVVIVGKKEGETNNEMSTVSSQSFSVEETNRYAGSRGDPARMMSNYAGAQGTDDSRNDIVIRGNSPLGVIYRIEGVSIPNPNHFAISGSTGGPISILNNKFLDNSDFFMSAFPAEYGNSTSGVFDLRLRKGNNNVHEFSGQFGFLGTEALFEGPLSKNHKGSYLVMGRYSTLTLIDKIGIKYGTDAVPVYGDGAFKFDFPLKGGSNLSLWGIGGGSAIDILISDQTEPAQDAYGDQDRDQHFRTRMFSTGLTYKKPFSKNCLIKSSIAYSYQNQNSQHEYILRHLGTDSTWIYDADPFTMMGYQYTISTASAYFSINQKLNQNHVLKYGFNVDAHYFNMSDSIRNDISDSLSAFYYRWDYISKTPAVLAQLFVQWKYKIGEKTTLNAGLHSQYFSFSNSLSPVEPRLGLKYEINEKNTLAIAGGLHSQTHPLYIYTYHQYDGAGNKVLHNQNIDFLKSVHSVVSYTLNLKGSLQLKSEVYYQYLYNVPVEIVPSAFSLLNQGSGFSRFFPDSLQNTGTGYNYGAELTVQKYFNKSFFFLTTLSLYQSRYTGSDGIERNTDFNGNYISNLLVGKEFKIGKDKRHTLALGMKVTYAGGKRYGYVDTVATNLQKEIIYLDSAYNERQFHDYFRLDAKINYTINGKKVSHEIGLDLINLLNTKNILGLTYVPNPDNPSEPYTQRNQLGFLPLFYYKLDFKVAGSPNS